MAVFEAVRTINGWKVGLTAEASKLAGVNQWWASVDQYGRITSTGCSPAMRPTEPLDLLRMHSLFIREAAAWTRECMTLPRRPRARCPAKGVMCARIAEVANQRLAHSGPFAAGVATYGLRTCCTAPETRT